MHILEPDAEQQAARLSGISVPGFIAAIISLTGVTAAAFYMFAVAHG